MNTEKPTGEGELTPIKEGEEVINKHNAVLSRTLFYKGQQAKPGFVWFVYKITKTIPIPPDSKGKFRPPFKKKLTGAVMLKKVFADLHGDANVNNMIIVNILNKY